MVCDYDLWFKTAVEKGLARLDRGEFIEHDDVIKRIEQIVKTGKDERR